MLLYCISIHVYIINEGGTISPHLGTASVPPSWQPRADRLPPWRIETKKNRWIHEWTILLLDYLILCDFWLISLHYSEAKCHCIFLTNALKIVGRSWRRCCLRSITWQEEITRMGAMSSASSAVIYRSQRWKLIVNVYEPFIRAKPETSCCVFCHGKSCHCPFWKEVQYTNVL